MTRIETLEAQLQTIPDRRRRIDTLNELIWTLDHKDLARSAILLDEVATLVSADQVDPFFYPTGMAEYQVNSARLNTYRGHYEDGLRDAQQVISHFVESEYDLIRCKALEIAGICHVRLGRPSDALALLMDALHLAIHLGDSQREANIYNLFAILYVNLGDHANGATYFQKSLVLSRKIGDRVSEARAMVNLCMSYRDLGRYAESLQCGNDSLALAHQIGSQTLEIGSMHNLANTYIALGELETAFDYFQQAAKLAEQLGDTFDQASTLLSMARAFLQGENFPLAKSHALFVLEIVRTNKQLGLQFEAHELLAGIYKAEGDFAQALEHYQAFHHIKERIFNKEADEKLKQLEVAHRTETAERDAEIYQLRYVELQREITERERVQKALVQAQKLESLGVLAGGVAHDFNNLLVSILGQTDLAIHKLEETHPIRQHLLKARRASEQAAVLARKMLAYSGRGRFQVVGCYLDELFKENQALWQSLVGEQCRLHIESTVDQWLVEVDKSQVEQLFTNLLINAAEAEAKTITVRAATQIIDQDDVRFWQYTAQPLPNGHYFLITVADDGIGMDSPTLEKIFDPFFTTKFTGRGLGMAASLGIIRGHRGGIAVQSQPNVGSSFAIVLPIAEPIPSRSLNAAFAT